MVAKRKPTFNSRDLADRYDCTLRTIHAMERKKGFPVGDVYSKGLLWSVPKVLAWEKEHMPHLHAGANIDESAEQAAEWNKRARLRALKLDDEDESEPAPEKKTKRPRGRKPK